MKPQIIFLAFTILLGSCASTYKAINPNNLTYLSKSTDKSVTLEYQYHLLTSKYAEKELDNDVKLVAIKITNNSGHDIVLGKDTKIYLGDTIKVIPVDKKLVYNRLKQQSRFYLLYLALTTAVINLSNDQPDNNLLPIVYIIGPGVAAGNFVVATSVNSRFKKDLNKYYLVDGATIKDKSTFYGLLGVKTWDYKPLIIKVD